MRERCSRPTTESIRITDLIKRAMPARRFPPPWTDCAHAVADAIIVDGDRRVLMKSNVTRLDDAKALRAMGIPLNTPVEDCELSRSADRRIAAVFKSTRAFGNAVLPWAQKQTAQRLSIIRRTRKKLKRALERAVPEDEEPELVAVALIIEPCRLVCEQWDAIFTALENGEPVRIQGEGAPWPLGPFPGNPHEHPPGR